MVSLLPKVLQTKSNIAIEECISKSLDIDINPFLIYLIDHVDIRLLKYLAYQFHILGNEGWSLATTEEEQRTLIKMAIKLHRIKGTKAAIEYCLNVLGFVGEVQQWYEYNGRRNRFKIVVTLTNGTYTNEMYSKLVKYVSAFKNKRSALETIDIQVYPKGEFYTFGRVVVDEVVTIKGVRNND